jgi:hypothetical protein
MPPRLPLIPLLAHPFPEPQTVMMPDQHQRYNHNGSPYCPSSLHPCFFFLVCFCAGLRVVLDCMIACIWRCPTAVLMCVTHAQVHPTGDADVAPARDTLEHGLPVGSAPVAGVGSQLRDGFRQALSWFGVAADRGARPSSSDANSDRDAAIQRVLEGRPRLRRGDSSS